jgi:DNA polymerase-4
MRDQSPRVLFVDMNSYFASVEQLDDPTLRGRPVAVTATDVPTGTCVAASYEAKSFGVRTGCLVGEARRLCPHIEIRLARPQRYIAVHHEIVRAVWTCLPVERVESVDEMWGRLSLEQRDRPAAVTLARQVKAAIRTQVGRSLACTVGVAPNRFLAKVATEMQKPDGLVVLDDVNLPDALFSLKLRDLPGIGPNLHARLQRYGIDSVEAFCRATADELVEIFRGPFGRRWHAVLRGQEVEPTPGHRKSVGHSHVLPPQRRHAAAARATMVRLVHKAGQRLREHDLYARRVTFRVALGWSGARWKRVVKLTPTRSTAAVLREFSRVWPRQFNDEPTKVGVVFDHVEPQATATPTLPFDRHCRDELDTAMDAINRRHGRGTIFWGGTCDEAVPDATRLVDRHIAFGHVPTLADA